MTPRWVIKRTAKWGLEWAMAFSGIGWLYRATPMFRSGYRILTYHRISDRREDSHTLRTDHFKSHMKYLSDHYPVDSLTALTKGLTIGPRPEAGTISVTFDDGYAEAAGEVRETLDRYRIPATFFVVTGLLDRGNVSARGGPYLTWDDVRALASAGFEIGSHTVDHISLGEMSLDRVEKQLKESRQRIWQETGAMPEGLSYPYGTLRDVSESIARVASNSGYRHAVTAIHGLNHPGCNPFLMRRTTITAGDGLCTFRMILKGYLDPWVLVDKWGYRFQRPRSRWT